MFVLAGLLGALLLGVAMDLSPGGDDDCADDDLAERPDEDNPGETGDMVTDLPSPDGVTDGGDDLPALDWYGATDGGDRLIGGDDFDAMNGYGGDDLIDGRGGDDDLRGGDGDDTIHGGAGDDWIQGGAGHDRLYAGAGDDVLMGQGGNDTLFAGSGTTQLYGGAGDDLLVGGTGVAWSDGGEGNDTLIAGTGADDLSGSCGDDLLVGNAELARVYMRGGEGDDILMPHNNDYAEGGAGNDRYVIDAGITEAPNSGRFQRRNRPDPRHLAARHARGHGDHAGSGGAWRMAVAGGWSGDRAADPARGRGAGRG